jgi:HEPN domain-containing protein
LWKSEFQEKNPFHWDRSLIFHPVSNLLGVAFETCVKGLLICRGETAPHTHDLEKLLSRLSDRELEARLDESLHNLRVPQELLDLNDSKERSDITAMYRRHALHVHLLTKLYHRPYASRYPVLGGHSLPDVDAVRRITTVAQQVLEKEVRRWTPS